MRTLVGILCLVVWAGATRAADVEALVKDLQAKKPDVRRAAASRLGELGDKAKPAVPALVKALKEDDDAFVRRFAARSLGKIGGGDKDAAAALAAALRNKDKLVAEAAAEALGGMGAAGVKPLAAILRDKSTPVETRRRAVQSLGKIGPPAKPAVPALIDLLKDRQVRLDAANALGNVGPGARAAEEMLAGILADRRERDRPFKRAVNAALNKIQGRNRKR